MPAARSARPQPLSLKGRAIALLAQREQSQAELRRKLIQYALRPAPGGDDQDATEADPAALRADAEARVDEVIAWLVEHGHLSERRFVESRIHARAPRYGNQRIRQELSQHGVTLDGEDAAALKQSELGRAQDVWQRKFGEPAADAAGRARQARFLIARGFTGETVRRVVLAQKKRTRSGEDD